VEKRVCKLEFKKDDPKSVTKTQQHFAKDLDIKNIVAKYKRTGVLGNPLNTNRKPFYGDFTVIKDLQGALEVVQTAQDGWNRLPTDLKIRFNQNPQDLLDFVSNPANLEEGVKLGLIPEEKLPPKVEKVEKEVTPKPAV